MWKILRELRFVRLISKKAIPCQHSYTVSKPLLSFTNSTTGFFAPFGPDQHWMQPILTPRNWGTSKQLWSNMDPTRLFKLVALPDESLPHSEELFINVHESLLAKTSSVQNLNRLPQERSPWSMSPQTWVKRDFSFFSVIVYPHHIKYQTNSAVSAHNAWKPNTNWVYFRSSSLDSTSNQCCCCSPHGIKEKSKRDSVFTLIRR